MEVTWVFKETGDIIEGKELNTEELLSLSTNNDVEYIFHHQLRKYTE